MAENSGQKSHPLEFDRKLGEGFLSGVPAESGVYLWKDDQGLIIYVGKAKNLRRRLSQYRLAPAKKPYRKMRLIVRRAATLEFRLCESEREALLLENQLIQEHRPELNVAGAYSFLYPCLGLRASGRGELAVAYTTSPEALEPIGFKLYGAFRSRLVVGEAFDALAALLPFIGHLSPKERKEIGDVAYSRILCFRQIPTEWNAPLEAFFRGEEASLLPALLMHLLERPGARRQASEIQQHLSALEGFFELEAKALRTVMKGQGIEAALIPQAERDRLFLSNDAREF